MKVTYRLTMEDHCQPELEMPSPESIAELLDLEYVPGVEITVEDITPDEDRR